ncbi:hypothetical protein HC766_03145 [Candidatus Gracilibacteria bacterium]|nr:hypothetical protein [Candidatus Gracilibacteria bacterium]
MDLVLMIFESRKRSRNLESELIKWESVICEITQVTKLKLYNNPADVLSDYLIGNDVPKIEYIQSYDGMEVMRIRQELKILVGSEDSFNKIIHLSNRLRIIEREKNILENTLGYVC